MPELPEVETVKRRLEAKVLGKTIRSAKVVNRSLRKPVTRNFAGLVKGRTVSFIERRAKYLLIRLSAKNEKDLIWMVHLGMSGRVVYEDKLHTAQKYTCVQVDFNDGSGLLHNDIRRFGLSLVGEEAAFTELKNLGVEPLNREFDTRYLSQACEKSKRTIKALIMDQKVLVGVGNIYANEALFLARILPTRRACDLSNRQINQLAKAIKAVLTYAINEGGSSISDFLDSDGTKGSYQDQFKVYSNAGRACQRCRTVIKKIKHDGRSSFICDNCQK